MTTRTPHRTLAAALLVTAACTRAAPDPAEGGPGAHPAAAEAAPALGADVEPEIDPGLLRRFQPLRAPAAAPESREAVAMIDLGRRLFHEPRLSQDDDLSCSSCHDLARYGVDGEPVSRGRGGQQGARNAPTVYNAAGLFTQFWDGRALTIEEQAKGPIFSPAEMGTVDPDALVAKLRAAPAYAAAFQAAFPGEGDPITLDHVARAIGAFERRLVTPSRWDQFLLGDRGALTRAEKVGLKTFLDTGCMACHTGTFLGGSMFQKVGVVVPWPNQRDPGRMAVTKNEADRMVFKVPSLRNVETAPYFHDASAATLEQAVAKMAWHQLGVELRPEEVSSIVTWLGSLTGELPRDAFASPPPPPDATPVAQQGR